MGRDAGHTQRQRRQRRRRGHADHDGWGREGGGGECAELDRRLSHCWVQCWTPRCPLVVNEWHMRKTGTHTIGTLSRHRWLTTSQENVFYSHLISVCTV